MTALNCGHLGNRCYPCRGLKLPAGYRVEYHEARGYDSPDRWYEAISPRGLQCSSFGDAKEAARGCWDHKRHRDWHYSFYKDMRGRP